MKIDIYETMNSIYIIDLSLKRYLRMPNSERSRTINELLNMNYSEWMDDHTWYDLEDSDDPAPLIPSPYPVDNGALILNVRRKGCVGGILTTPVLRKNNECISST